MVVSMPLGKGSWYGFGICVPNLLDRNNLRCEVLTLMKDTPLLLPVSQFCLFH
jgi:hypothetical protein